VQTGLRTTHYPLFLLSPPSQPLPSIILTSTMAGKMSFSQSLFARAKQFKQKRLKRTRDNNGQDGAAGTPSVLSLIPSTSVTEGSITDTDAAQPGMSSLVPTDTEVQSSKQSPSSPDLTPSSIHKPTATTTVKHRPSPTPSPAITTDSALVQNRYFPKLKGQANWGTYRINRNEKY
jgi:hypothetical protein